MGETIQNMEGKLPTSPYEYIESSIKCHEFKSLIFGAEITFSILKMDGCTLIWIGDQFDKRFSDLSVSMMSRFGNDPLSTKIVGASTEMSSQSLAKKLCKKLGKQVYLSLNLKSDRSYSEIEKRLCEEIKNKPDAF